MIIVLCGTRAVMDWKTDAKKLSQIKVPTLHLQDGTTPSAVLQSFNLCQHILYYKISVDHAYGYMGNIYFK